MAATTPLSSPLLRRGLYLEYLTRGWNVVGASLIVVWQLKGIGQDRERTALRLIGASFFALALYVLAQAAYALLSARTRRNRRAASPGSPRR